MNENKLYLKWWFWLFVVIMSIVTVFLIVAESYAFHPTEIRLYANDQMVATAQGLTQQLEDQKFNDCVNNCKGASDECYFTCYDHYSNETTIHPNDYENMFDRCVNQTIECKIDLAICKNQ